MDLYTSAWIIYLATWLYEYNLVNKIVTNPKLIWI